MDIKLIKAMVIGDGSLSNGRERQRYRNYRFSCLHSSKQKDYLLWKRELLSAAGLPTWYSESENIINPHTGKKGLMCKMESPVDARLTILHGQMYPKSEGFKPGILEDIDDLGLAIIFMDDGCRQVNKTMSARVNGKSCRVKSEPYIGSFRISMQSHGWTGASQFCCWLGDRYGIHATGYSQLGKPVIGIHRLLDKEKFRDIISPFIHPSMSYKLDGSFLGKHTSDHRERLSERTPEEVRGMRQSELAGNEPREGAPKSLPADEGRS